MTAADRRHTSMAADADLQPSPDAANMADALRSGVALRRQQEAASPGADAARLNALGDLDSLGPVAKPGAAAPLVKLGRRALLVLLRPWLAMQTIFNRELARRFDEQATTVRDLRRRVPLIEDAMQTLDTRLRAVEGLRPSTVARGASSADLTSLCRMFVHSRLPSPPADVLVLPGSDADIVGDLGALGYRVQSSPDAQADVVIAPFAEHVPGSLAIADARLRPHARALLLATAPSTIDDVNPPRIADEDAPGWRVEEWLVAAGDSWGVVVTPGAGQTVLGVVMARQGQADAPAR